MELSAARIVPLFPLFFLALWLVNLTPRALALTDAATAWKIRQHKASKEASSSKHRSAGSAVREKKARRHGLKVPDPLMEDFLEDDGNPMEEEFPAEGAPMDEADMPGVHENEQVSQDFPEDAMNPLDKLEPEPATSATSEDEAGDPGSGSRKSVEGTTHEDFKADDGKHPGDPGTLDTNMTLDETDLDGIHDNAALNKDLPEDARNPLDKFDPSVDVPDGSGNDDDGAEDEKDGEQDSGDETGEEEGENEKAAGDQEKEAPTGPIIIDKHVDPDTNETGGEMDSGNADEGASDDDGQAGASEEGEEVGGGGNAVEKTGKIIVDKHVDPDSNETSTDELDPESEQPASSDADGEDEDTASEGKSNEDGRIITDRHVDPDTDETSTEDDDETGGADDAASSSEETGKNATNITDADPKKKLNVITIPGCVTREDERIDKASWRKTVAKPNSSCVFGTDPRDEGKHCIFEADMRYGSYGWCWTSPDDAEWGSCAPDCPLFGQAKVLGKKIEKLTKMVASALSKPLEDEAASQNLTNATAKNGSSNASSVPITGLVAAEDALRGSGQELELQVLKELEPDNRNASLRGSSLVRGVKQDVDKPVRKGQSLENANTGAKTSAVPLKRTRSKIPRTLAPDTGSKRPKTKKKDAKMSSE